MIETCKITDLKVETIRIADPRDKEIADPRDKEIADLKDSNARLADALAAAKVRAGDTYGP